MATATHFVTPEEAQADGPLEAVVVRFAGDSGDGMQLTGGQFTLSTALAGNDLATFPISPRKSARRRGRPSESPPFRSISAPPRSRLRATLRTC
jgi:2-oxoglutarate ferredoxin oxidoreductase subunit alpha